MCSPVYACRSAAAILARTRGHAPSAVRVTDFAQERLRLSLGRSAHTRHLANTPRNHVYCTGKLYPRPATAGAAELQAVDMQTDAQGLGCLEAAVGMLISVEAALFPMLFPNGRGWFQDTHFAAYLQHRMQQSFSLFTLYPPYLIVMFQLRQVHAMVSGQSTILLKGQVAELRAKHPSWTEEQIYRHCLQWHVPPKLPGSPSYHREKLEDLLCMVDTLGLPTHFLTLTSDEVSELRWEEIDNLDCALERFVNGMTWQVGTPLHTHVDAFEKPCLA